MYNINNSFVLYLVIGEQFVLSLVIGEQLCCLLRTGGNCFISCYVHQFVSSPMRGEQHG